MRATQMVVAHFCLTGQFIADTVNRLLAFSRVVIEFALRIFPMNYSIVDR